MQQLGLVLYRTVKTILGCFVQLDGVDRGGPYAHRIRPSTVKYWLLPLSIRLVLYFLPPETGFYRPPGRQDERLGLARVTNTRSLSSVQCLGLAGTWDSITIMFLISHRV
jgi:hypothetical protein